MTLCWTRTSLADTARTLSARRHCRTRLCMAFASPRPECPRSSQTPRASRLPSPHRMLSAQGYNRCKLWLRSRSTCRLGTWSGPPRQPPRRNSPRARACMPSLRNPSISRLRIPRRQIGRTRSTCPPGMELPPSLHQMPRSFRRSRACRRWHRVRPRRSPAGTDRTASHPSRISCPRGRATGSMRLYLRRNFLGRPANSSTGPRRRRTCPRRTRRRDLSRHPWRYQRDMTRTCSRLSYCSSSPPDTACRRQRLRC